MAAWEEARAEFAAQGFGLVGKRSFVGACAEGDLLFASEGVGAGAVAYAGKLEAVQQQANFGGRARTNFDAGLRVCG